MTHSLVKWCFPLKKTNCADFETSWSFNGLKIGTVQRILQPPINRCFRLDRKQTKNRFDNFFLPLMMIHQRQTDLHPSLHCVQVSMIIHWFHNDLIIRLHSSLIDHLTLNKTAIKFYNFCAKSCEEVERMKIFLKMKFDWTKINRWRRKKNPGGSFARTPTAEKKCARNFFLGISVRSRGRNFSAGSLGRRVFDSHRSRSSLNPGGARESQCRQLNVSWAAETCLIKKWLK